MPHRRAAWKVVAQRYPCTTCNAAPGEPCRRPGGRASDYVHVTRSRLASANHWKDPEDEQPPDDGRR